MSSIRNPAEVVHKQESGEAEFDKDAGMLQDSNIVRTVVASEGTKAEVAESDSSSVKKPRGLDVDSSPRPKIDFNGVYISLAKDQVTVVIPTLNEAEAISKVLQEVKEAGYRNVLVVEGYSKDKTAEKVHQNGARLTYQHSPGKAGAVITAIEHVETPYMLFMDGDCTYDPKDIWRLLNHAEHYSHVIGARDKRNIPLLHRLGNWVISKTFSLLFGVSISDVCSGMYLIETKVAREYRLRETGFAVEIELAACSAAGEDVTEVPISYRPRVGEGKLNAWHGFSILFAAFILFRRYNPIFLYSGLTALSVVPATIILGWVALELLTTGIWHSGWVIIGVLLMLVAAQALTLASVSILTRHSEERLMHELRRTRTEP